MSQRDKIKKKKVRLRNYDAKISYWNTPIFNAISGLKEFTPEKLAKKIDC